MTGHAQQPAGVLIFGGSFNPLHIGHLRLALECAWGLRSLVWRVDFLPAYCPPHKLEQPILPFALRCQMITEAIADIAAFYCNDIEKTVRGPSYTYDILGHYLKLSRAENLYFLLGSEDLPLLPGWHSGRLLPERCNLVVVPRGDCDRTRFWDMVCDIWPQAQADERNALSLSGACARIPGAHRIFYMPVPWLDVRASRIRSLWLERRDIRFLVPGVVLQLLDKNADLVRRSWQENFSTCST